MIPRLLGDWPLSLLQKFQPGLTNGIEQDRARLLPVSMESLQQFLVEQQGNALQEVPYPFLPTQGSIHGPCILKGTALSEDREPLEEALLLGI